MCGFLCMWVSWSLVRVLLPLVFSCLPVYLVCVDPPSFRSPSSRGPHSIFKLVAVFFCASVCVCASFPCLYGFQGVSEGWCRHGLVDLQIHARLSLSVSTVFFPCLSVRSWRSSGSLGVPLHLMTASPLYSLSVWLCSVVLCAVGKNTVERSCSFPSLLLAPLLAPKVDGVRWLYRSETFVLNVRQVLHCQVFNLDVCAFYDLKLFTQAYTGRTCLICCLCYFCQCRLKIGGMWYVIVWRTLLDR